MSLSVRAIRRSRDRASVGGARTHPIGAYSWITTSINDDGLRSTHRYAAHPKRLLSLLD